MNILLDELPETVMLNGREVEINTDFRTSIFFKLLMEDEEISDDDKIVQAIELYYGCGVVYQTEITEAVENILWFLRCGKPLKESKKEDDEDDEEDNEEIQERVLDYEIDGPLIYAAFAHDYQLRLKDMYMHWWEFEALFQNLNESNEIVKIMQYRGMKIDADMSKSQQAFYRKMKRIHALPLKASEQQFIDQLEELLMNGGNVREFLQNGVKNASED